MSTYLVTGCAGFIGARTTEHLLAQGHRVVGVDNLNDAYDRRLKDWRLARIDGRPDFHFRRLDITERATVRDLLGRSAAEHPIDAVINLAAYAGVRYSVENPWVYYDTNVTGSLHLLDACREFGISKFVLASSSSLY